MKPITISLFMCLLAVTALWPQQPGRDTASIDLGMGRLTIEYGTPKLDNRDIESMIIPGFAWRIGMNSPTTLDTTVDLDFGFGRKLAAGKYALFARRDTPGEWTLFISNNLSNTVLHPSTVVLEAPLYLTIAEEYHDLLKITLEKSGNRAMLVVAWGAQRLSCILRPAGQP